MVGNSEPRRACGVMGAGTFRFVTVGRRRIITDSPADFLACLAAKVDN